jgi:hypothetical protein
VAGSVFSGAGQTASTTATQSASAPPKNVIVFYDDFPSRGDPQYQVTEQIALPLVAHVDKNGNPTDWMFDSFVFYSYYLYVDKTPSQSYVDTWIKYLYDGHQVANLDATVRTVKTALKQPDYQLRVFLTIPVANESVKTSSITKNIDKILAYWNRLNPRNLKLVGLYWGFTEDVLSVPGLTGIIPDLAKYVHGKGLKLLIIPFFNAWFDPKKLHDLGFDYVTLQPNYAWRSDNPINRFAVVNSLITGGYIDGAEFELVAYDPVYCCNGDWRVNLQTYIGQADQYAWYRDRIATYYFGSDISQMGRDPRSDYRSGYDAIYQYIQATRS